MFITTGLYFDPMDTATRLRYDTLSSAGYSGITLCVVYDRTLKNSHIGNFSLISLYLPRFLQGYGSIRGILRAFYYFGFCIWKGHSHRQQYDVSIGTDPFKTGFLCYLLFRLTKKPYIVEVAGNYIRSFSVNERNSGFLSKLKQRYVKSVSPFVLERAAAVKLLYESQIDGLATLSDASKINVFHDITAYDQFHKSNIDNKFILSVGHPWHLKGMDVLIKAFNLIQDRIPGYRLHIVGYSPDIDEFEKLAAGNPYIILDNKGLPFEEVASLFMSCSLFVLASRTEAMGRVLLEAMASGKPVIASNIDGIPRIVRHDYNGLLFETENVDELAHKMLALLNDREHTDRLIKAGLRSIQDQFSCESFIRHYQSMVSNAAKNALQN